MISSFFIFISPKLKSLNLFALLSEQIISYDLNKYVKMQ